jgi:hypothetical protein
MTQKNGTIAPKPARSRNPKQTLPAPVATPAKSPSKKDQVLALLQRNGGATLEELVAATGWLKHTTRATLTGLRKAGHTIEKGKRGDTTCYSIKAAA